MARGFEAVIGSQGFGELPISPCHARIAGEMNVAHKDPVDRFLIAQALAEVMEPVSHVALFDTCAVRRLW